jgi:hypothetical protein
MSMKIGEFLVHIGAMSEARVEEVLAAQKEGDDRLFGEIAVARGLLADSALKRFTDFLEKHEEFETDSRS